MKQIVQEVMMKQIVQETMEKVQDGLHTVPVVTAYKETVTKSFKSGDVALHQQLVKGETTWYRMVTREGGITEFKPDVLQALVFCYAASLGIYPVEEK